MINIMVNGDAIKVEESLSLKSYINGIGFDLKKVAIEVNREIVPKSEYINMVLKENDELEIVHFIGGG